MSAELSDLITGQKISEIADRYGFQDKVMEKFLMDYLVHQYVTDAIECVTKGGMCMAFYPTGDTLQRLSVDIDLATKLPASSVESAMKHVAGMPNAIRVQKHSPSKQAVPKNNLVTYYVYYKSDLSPEGRIKIDFLYGLDFDYSIRTIPAGRAIIEFKTPHEIRILTRSALLADKLGTLAEGTIGLEAEKRGDIAKQIFDVGCLISGASSADITGFFVEFQKILEKEKAINSKLDISARDVTASIQTALDGMLNVKNQVKFTSDARKGYLDFKSTHISRKTRYEVTDHHANILVIRILNHLVGEVLDGKSGEDAAAEMYEILQNAGNVSTYEDVQALYGSSTRNATGSSESGLGRMSARSSCLICAYAALTNG